MYGLHAKTQARIRVWQSQPEVIGIVLIGSRSAGRADVDSDDDLLVVLEENALTQRGIFRSEVAHGDEPDKALIVYDAEYVSLSLLSERVDSPADVDHWSLEHAQILYDRDTSVTAVICAVRAMGENFRRSRIHYALLDLYFVRYRHSKLSKRGGPVAERLLLTRGAIALARIVFALEQRWVPETDWLEIEARTLPDPDGAVPGLLSALDTGGLSALVEAFKRLEPRLQRDFDFPPPGPERGPFYFQLLHPSRVAERQWHRLS